MPNWAPSPFENQNKMKNLLLQSTSFEKHVWTVQQRKDDLSDATKLSVEVKAGEHFPSDFLPFQLLTWIAVNTAPPMLWTLETEAGSC